MREGEVRPGRPNVPSSSILQQKEEVDMGQEGRDARKRLSRDDQQRIGRELIAARKLDIDWKELEAKYGLRRCRLWQLWRAAQKAAKKNVYKHLGASEGSGG